MAKTKLVLFPGSGKSYEFASKIGDILSKDYGLGKRIYLSASGDEADRTDKGPYRPLFVGFFDDKDPRVEGGEDEVSNFNKQFVAVVNYLYEPESSASINDKFMETISMFYLLKNNASPLRKVLVAPYLPYVRAHSVDKYKNRGFIEADRLEMFVDMLAKAEVQDIFTIHHHSEKVIDYCKARGIRPHAKESFRNDKYIDPRKLGFGSDGKAGYVLDKLQPIVNEVKRLKQKADQEGKKFYVVVPDDSAETLVETLAIDSGIGYNLILNILKERIDAGIVSIKGLKDFCMPDPDDLRGSMCAIADDMTSSGNTQDEIGRFLKNKHGVGYVCGIVSHAACPDKAAVNNLRYIDDFIALDTIPQSTEKIKFLDSSADILAASLYRCFSREMAKLGERVN